MTQRFDGRFGVPEPRVSGPGLGLTVLKPWDVGRAAAQLAVCPRSCISRYFSLAREDQEEDEDEDERHPEEPEQNKDHGLRTPFAGHTLVAACGGG